MTQKIQVTRDDIDNVALKLDEFATILNPRERALLIILFQRVDRHTPSDGPKKDSTLASDGAPALSMAFRAALSSFLTPTPRGSEEQHVEHLP